MDQEKVIKKVVFREADAPNQSKAVFGYVKILDDDFIEVITTKGSKFTINKKFIVFIKEGDYQ